MKMFFDTIEEVSGEEATNVVLETAGFRQGKLVGSYFSDLKNVTAEKAAEMITNTYAFCRLGHRQK
jgi:rsbT co-antagonist protein RsbR